MQNSASKNKILYIDEPIKIVNNQSELASVAFESLVRTSEEALEDLSFKDSHRLVSGSTETLEGPKIQNPIKISRTDLVFNVHTREPAYEKSPKHQTIASQIQNGKVITGEIQNSQGLPFGGEYHIQVRQLKDSREVSVGEVNAEFGKYKIPVANLEGEVLAELVNAQGEVMGFDSYTINESTINERSGRYIGRKLILKPKKNPVYAGSSGRQNSGGIPPSYDKALNLTNRQFSNSQRSGTNLIAQVTKNLSESSSSLIEVRGKSSPPVLALNLVQNLPSLRSIDNLYLDSVIKVIEAQTNTSYIDPNLGVIFGKVTFGNQELMGAQVEVEGLAELTTVYFNTMMPDIDLPATSENGTFVIFNVPTGYFSLKVKVGGQYWSHENVVSRAGSVSQVEIRSTIEKNDAEVYAFDPFSGISVPTILSTQAIVGDLSITNRSKMILQNLNRESLYHVNAEGDYLAHTGFFNESQRQIVIPRVSERWLNSLISTTTVQKNTGIIIGFVDSENYEVFLPHEEKESGAQLVYFNSVGVRTDSSVLNGGFVLMNVPKDIQSVLVYDKDLEIFHSKVLPVDDQSISVLRFSKSLDF